MGQKHGVHSRGKVNGVSGLSSVEPEQGLDSKGKGREVYCWSRRRKHGVDSRDKGRSSSSNVGLEHGNDSRVECGGEVVSKASPFEDLPVDCICNIMSFTSQRDACVAASVSKSIKSAVDSDAMWEKFLPPDYESLIPGSRVFSSKKELYFALCDHFLIEGGKKSFWLEKETGKKCIMLSALDLTVKNGEDAQNSLEYWKWYPIPESRFDRVGEIVTTFKIHGTIDSSILCQRTIYSVYVVFKKLDHFSGFEDCTIEAITTVIIRWNIIRRLVCFDPSMDNQRFEGYNGRMKPKQRKDGWMELELGDFYNEGRNKIIVTASPYKSNPWMEGLIIEGLEIRPTGDDDERFMSLESY